MRLIEQMRRLEKDHPPGGWPAVRMQQITLLCDELERLRDERDAALNVLVDMGGEVRLPEVLEAQSLRKDAERYRFMRDADKSNDLIPDMMLYALDSLDSYVDAAMAEYAELALHNVKAKRAPTAGRQARAGENVPLTTSPGLVARRWCSA